MELTEREALIAAKALGEYASALRREAAGRKWAGPGHADIRKALREDAAEMLVLRNKLRGR